MGKRWGFVDTISNEMKDKKESLILFSIQLLYQNSLYTSMQMFI